MKKLKPQYEYITLEVQPLRCTCGSKYIDICLVRGCSQYIVGCSKCSKSVTGAREGTRKECIEKWNELVEQARNRKKKRVKTK